MIRSSKIATMKLQAFSALVLSVLVKCNALVKIEPLHPTIAPPFYPKFPPPGLRVVGGQEATPNAFPHQAALFIQRPDRTYFCGGSLISTKYVLTAAHCVDDASEIEVVLGAHNVREIEATQVRMISTKFAKHEDYDANLISNDIGVIELPEPVQLNAEIQTVNLPAKSDVGVDFVGALTTVSGWGKITDSDTTYTTYLHYVESDVISNDACNTSYWGAIRDTNICTDGEEGKSPCNGDSGGALVFLDKVIGIVSFGVIFGCEVGFPGAFTRVTSYLAWINEHTGILIQE